MECITEGNVFDKRSFPPRVLFEWYVVRFDLTWNDDTTIRRLFLFFFFNYKYQEKTMHVQRYIDWKRHTRSNIFSFPPWISSSLVVSHFLIARASFIQIYSSSSRASNFSRVTKRITNFLSIPSREEDVFIQQLSRKEGKEKTRIPPSPKKYTRCPPPKRTTPNPKSLDDTRMNEACLYVCVDERKIEEWTVARGTKPR